MINKLLSATLFAMFALSVSAYEVGDYVYTRTAKFQVRGADLVQNGKFDQGLTGVKDWTSHDDMTTVDEVFMVQEGGPNGLNTLAVIDGKHTLTNGMYQIIPIAHGGTYVMSFKIKGAIAGFTDTYLTGASTNYINFYYNTDGSVATAGDAFGENAAGGMNNEFSFGAEAFEEMAFSVDAPADGNLIIDIRALTAGLEIADIECHLADQVYDNRVAERRVAYINTFFAAKDFSDRDYYDDILYAIEEVENGIKANASPDVMELLVSNMDAVWDEFVAVNFYNILDYIPTTNGSDATGNNSANWMNWTGSWSYLSTDYNGKAPWSWSNNRWSKSSGAGKPMHIYWGRGTSGWNCIATLTATLKPGDYFWGVSGIGGSHKLSKNAVSMARETAEVRMFFNNDTTEAVTFSPLYQRTLVYMFTIEGEEEKEVTLGMICNPNVDQKDGFRAEFYNPVLYMTVEEDQLTPEDELNIKSFQAQLETLQNTLDKANAYLSPEQVELPWGKDTLQLGVDTTLTRYEEWQTLGIMDIVEAYNDDIILADSVKSKGVNYLNGYIRKFENVNVPFVELRKGIDVALEVKSQRIYSGSLKMDEFTAKIAESASLYAESLLAENSEEAVLALQNMTAELAAAVEEFKAAIVAETIVDIDFGTQENPIAITEETDTLGYPAQFIDGNKGRMYIATATPPFELGYEQADSLGILRVGKGEAYVDFTGAPIKETDIVNVEFDLYVGSLSKKYAGYKLLGEEYEDVEYGKVVRDTICGIYFSKYSGLAPFNTFDVNFIDHISTLGGGGVGNAAIATESNRTHFNIVLDYGKKTMYCTTSGRYGTFTTEEIALRDITPARFVLYSDYNNSDRRCWFDNLLIRNIAAGPDTGISEVINNGTAVQNTAIYNLAGQRIAAPVKGQIYIQNGKKYMQR